MIKNLTNKAVVVGVFLASTFAIPANASDQKQVIWDNTYQSTAALDVTDAGTAYGYEVNSEAVVVSFRDGRGVGLDANMLLVAEITAQVREAALNPQASWYSQGALGAGFSHNAGVIQDEPAYGINFTHNAAIMRDGRGVGLVQASLTSDFTFTPTIAAAMGGNF